MKRKAEIVFLEGKKIILRPLSKEDINEKYLSWLNDEEVTRYTDTGTFPTTLEELKGFYKQVSKSKNSVMFAIIVKSSGKHIGNIKLGGINWVHRFADLGIMIGEKKYWNKGYGKEACGLLLEYAFRRLHLNKVILGVFGNHNSAIMAYQSVGFKIEGRFKKMLNLNGKYVDKVMMGINQYNFNKTIKD